MHGIEANIAFSQQERSLRSSIRGGYTDQQRTMAKRMEQHQPNIWRSHIQQHGASTACMSFRPSNVSLLTIGKLDLMRQLVMWSLHESEVVNAIIKDAYKQSRQTDDLNVPLSVQPWGKDELKRRYWLVEGRDDTDFRLYRENNPALKNGTWRSMAGSIDELKVVVEKLEKDKAQASRRLAQRITMAIPRFEATEEVQRPFIPKQSVY